MMKSNKTIYTIQAAAFMGGLKAQPTYTFVKDKNKLVC